MTELETLIHKMISREGPLSVAQFMQLALQHPEHGYYMKGDPLGVAGDFTTAPEISQISGELIGTWCAEMWRLAGKPDPFVLLELGPGRGTLMQDALRATAKVEGFHHAMRLHLLESNVTLRASQGEKLGGFAPCYLSGLESLPSLPVIAIANEFFDAMPVHQYEKTPEGWRERCVGAGPDGFVFVLGKAEVLLPLPDSLSFYEISPQSLAMVQALSSHIAHYGGAALIIDYGMTESSGANTLQAVSGHASVSPLSHAGSVDLTPHVAFMALRLAATSQGVSALPTITQEAFLKAMGIELRAWQLKMKAGYEQAMDIDSSLQRLIDPQQMGTLFKVTALVPTVLKEVPGFP